MDEKQKDIIKKVQKLLRLADNAGSEDEAQTAIARVREILDKYDLSLGDVKEFTEEECGEAEFVIKSRYIPAHIKDLVSAACMLCDCRAIYVRCSGNNRNRQKVVFVGVGADAVVAGQMFSWLIEFARRKTREKGLSGREKSDYLCGFSESVFVRAVDLKEQQRPDCPTCTSLVPLKDAAVRKYVDKKYRPEGSIRMGNRRFFTEWSQDGYADGQTVSLNRQVDAEHPAKPIE